MNNMTKLISALLTFITFGIAFPACAVEGESIVLDPATGNYLITHYSDIDRAFERLTFIPATKINPAVKIKLKHAREGVLNYRYTLSSGQDSQQEIEAFRLEPVSGTSTSLPDIPLNAPPGQIAVDMLDAAGYFEAPAPWDAFMAYSHGGKAFRVSWSYKVDGGLSPGKQAVFGFNSRDLPGIIQGEIYGYVPVDGQQQIDGEELPDAEDGGFGQQYMGLLKNDFVRRFVAVPTLSVTTPFDAVSVLTQLKSHLMTWPDMKLLDTAAATTIATGLQAAIDAVNAGNKEAAIKILKSLSSEIAKTDKELVKGVLKFDVKFVARMLGADEPEEDEVSFSVK